MCLPLIQPNESDAVTEEKESVVIEKERAKSPPKPPTFGSGSSATTSLSFAALASGGSTSGLDRKRKVFSLVVLDRHYSLEMLLEMMILRMRQISTSNLLLLYLKQW